jgi:hypothetical protein
MPTRSREKMLFETRLLFVGLRHPLLAGFRRLRLGALRSLRLAALRGLRPAACRNLFPLLLLPLLLRSYIPHLIGRPCAECVKANGTN